jgi:hypothetical protein
MVSINLNDLRNYLDNYEVENIIYNGDPVYTLTVDNEEIFNGADIFTYELLADDTYSISLADSTYSGPVVIPSMYKGKSISTIARDGFCDSNIKSVSFETASNINTIGSSAFKNCLSLTTITIPRTVKTIGVNAFAGTGLTSVTFEHNLWDIGNGTYKIENGQVGATALKSTYCTYSWTYYTAVAPRVTVNKPSYTSSLLEITIYNDNSLDLKVGGQLTYYLDGGSPAYNLPGVGEEIIAKNSYRTYKHVALDRELGEVASFNSAKLTNVRFIGSDLAALPEIEINKNGYVLTNGFVYPLHDQVYLNDNTSTSEIELDCMAYNENSKDLDWYIIIYDLDDEVIAATQSYIMPEDSKFITISLSSSIYFEGGTYEMYFADSEGNESAHIFGEIS